MDDQGSGGVLSLRLSEDAYMVWNAKMLGFAQATGLTPAEASEMVLNFLVIDYLEQDVEEGLRPVLIS